MRSAACYINKVRTESQARVTKVPYPGNIATNQNPLYASIACNPVFSEIYYSDCKICPITKKLNVKVSALAVDGVNGNNILAGMYPDRYRFKTINAALIYRNSLPVDEKILIFVYPSVYSEIITIPYNTSLIGTDLTTVIIQLNVSTTTTCLTILDSSSIENITLDVTIV